jgi:hypothetical protein
MYKKHVVKHISDLNKDENLNLKKGNEANILEFPLHLSLVLENNKNIGFVSNAKYANLEEKWSKEVQEKFFKVEDVIIKNNDPFQLPNLTTTNLYESRIQSIPRISNSNDLAKFVTENLSNLQDFMLKIKDKSFVVSYFDKYNQSEFSMRLMLQFINELQQLLSITVSEFNVHLEKAAFKSPNYPEYIIHNYKEYDDYTYDLNELSKVFSFKINIKEENRLPHYRFFQFTADDISFSIRIDGGIAHGFKPIDRLTSNDMRFEDQIFEIRKDVLHDIIYNISIDD